MRASENNVGGRLHRAALAVLVFGLAVMLLALPASAEHGEGSIDATACVDEDAFYLTVVGSIHPNLADSGGLRVRADQALSGEGFTLNYRVTPPDTVTITVEPSVGGSAPDRWQDGAFSYTLLANRVDVGDFLDAYDYEFSATILHGTVPFQVGHSVKQVGMLDGQAGAYLMADDVPVTECGGSVDGDVDGDQDGQTPNDGDCDDNDSTVYQGAPELDDGKDNDCDGTVDEGFDGDGDGYTLNGGDCDDTDAAVNPDAVEVDDGVDNDCDGTVDEGFDVDGDGFTPFGGDCNDADAAVTPDALEVDDGADNDCDGATDEGFDGNGEGTTDPPPDRQLPPMVVATPTTTTTTPPIATTQSPTTTIAAEVLGETILPVTGLDIEGRLVYFGALYLVAGVAILLVTGFRGRSADESG